MFNSPDFKILHITEPARFDTLTEEATILSNNGTDDIFGI